MFHCIKTHVDFPGRALRNSPFLIILRTSYNSLKKVKH
nr:MAG TPA: hypothetical protein [Caudoviricetes sp.]